VHFADDRLGERLPGFNVPARKRDAGPERTEAFLHQHTPRVIANHTQVRENRALACRQLSNPHKKRFRAASAIQRAARNRFGDGRGAEATPSRCRSDQSPPAARASAATPARPPPRRSAPAGERPTERWARRADPAPTAPPAAPASCPGFRRTPSALE